MTKLSPGALALKARFTAPLTPVALAKALEVTPAAVSSWIRGETRPSPDLRQKIADEVGIPVAAWDADLPDKEAKALDKVLSNLPEPSHRLQVLMGRAK